MLFNKSSLYYANEIKNGNMSVLELTERTLQLIDQYNPELNAVIDRFDQYALDKARTYDKKLQEMHVDERKSLPPFFGVPLLLKDIGQHLEGTVNSSGSKLRKGLKAHFTDNSIRLAEDAGFIFVGRSNIPEYGLKIVSDSPYYGKVKNPVDLTRNPGGSSGGASAAVKAGIVPLATASDAGGSIRVPASDTGLIGLKPSRGRVAEGPGFYRPVNGMSTNLVVSKTVDETFEYLKAVQLYQSSHPYRLKEIKEKTIEPLGKPLKIGVYTNEPLGRTMKPEAKETLEKTTQILKDLGHEVEIIDLDVNFKEVQHYYYQTMTVETGRLVLELETQAQEIHFEDVDPLTWATYKIAPLIPATDYARMTQWIDKTTEYMEELFNDIDVLLTPTASDVAAKNENLDYSSSMLEQIKNITEQENPFEVVKQAFDFYYQRGPYSQLFNFTGQPALSLPIYENKAGLPLGSQFVAPRGQEYLLLQLAKQIEDAGELKTEIVEL